MSEAPSILFDEKPFDLVRERRNGTRIYSARDRSSFLRIGPASEIDSELKLHHHLIEQGYPVPKILSESNWGQGEKCFRESSVGEDHFGILFAADTVQTGSIREETFETFRGLVARYVQAQAKEQSGDKDWESVFIATHTGTMQEELPMLREDIKAAWDMLRIHLAETPFVLCHGDLGPFNMLPGGVIDFETSFLGPLGYDLVSALSTIAWFPKRGDTEFVAGYSFSQKQTDQLLELLPGSLRTLDALLVLRGAWLAARMHRLPKLQAWRHAKFEEMIARYLRGESLFEWLCLSGVRSSGKGGSTAD